MQNEAKEIEENDAVSCLVDLLVMRLLCKIGLHKWQYFPQAPSFYEAFPEMRFISRRCKRCGTMQCTDDDGTPNWHRRL